MIRMRIKKQNRLRALHGPPRKAATAPGLAPRDPAAPFSVRPPRRPLIDFKGRDRWTHMHELKRRCHVENVEDLPVRVHWAMRARRLMGVA